MRQSDVAKQRVSAHSKKFVVNDRFVFLIPITMLVKFSWGNGLGVIQLPLANIVYKGCGIYQDCFKHNFKLYLFPFLGIKIQGEKRENK